ncbi:Metallo-hydrolase/oxidoreductase [Choiromyces venosus 120613-1]|uniref:Metallo-hydrolase/oxidoreductase n=1 Tax=Choiromyces venosus 120613-1 TaxID=1336337 RepID=A0A3N4JED4_9PEZI|nr:Metallo-hydrolase/oxidoreductase [Choiromyces venosus 120613-1]
MPTYRTRLTLDPTTPSHQPALQPPIHQRPSPSKSTKTHPTPHSTSPSPQTATLTFISTTTTLLEHSSIRILTDPNFLHAGEHIHLGPGVSSTRLTNPAVDMEDLPSVDLVLLSHYHDDRFNQKVETSLRRDLPIITTPHATSKGPQESFVSVYLLGKFESALVGISPGGKGVVKVTAVPGKHGPVGVFQRVNETLAAVPPTNGWMVELGVEKDGEVEVGYRIYISGDTLFVDELQEILERFEGKGVDLMLVHLGGTTIPGPSLPLVMVTMDAKQGVRLMRLINPEVTIPIHYDDYDVFLSPLDDFKKAVTEAGLDGKVVYLDRGDAFKFEVKVKPGVEK